MTWCRVILEDTVACLTEVVLHCWPQTSLITVHIAVYDVQLLCWICIPRSFGSLDA